MNIVILGASGSIGTQSIEVIRKNKNKWNLVGVSLGNRVFNLDSLIEEFNLKFVTLKNEKDYLFYKEKYKNINFFYGDDGLIALIKESNCEAIINALVGFVGAKPSIETIKNDKILLLANKESLVVCGELIKKELKIHKKAKLIPIDSEHVAIAKCLYNEKKSDVKYIVLTASGGPFFNTPLEEFKNIKKEDALKHPTWKMGEKITIDSATMMNKAFEIIEAHYLFNVGSSKIKVMVDQKSYVHSYVVFKDKIKLNVGPQDMKIPIEYSLNLGKPQNKKFLDVEENTLQNYSLKDMDYNKFSLINFGYYVIKKGGTSGAILNACNEECVKYFLQSKIKFIDIKMIIDKIMNMNFKKEYSSFEDLQKLDLLVRNETIKVIEKLRSNK